MKEDINSDYKKRFMKGFNMLCYSRSIYKVWSDIMLLFATSIANSIKLEQEEFKKVWQEREQSYLETIKQYSKKEQNVICQMFEMLFMELEQNPDQDLLGQLYMNLEISNSNAGQFFTPYDLCFMMAKLTYDRKSLGKIVHEQGYASICDCVCGAGATLIAASEQCKKYFKKYNYQNHTFYVGQDIDITCVHMCYIQLSLHGLAGYVIHGNTLTKPMPKLPEELNTIWFTPIWFNDVWSMRRMFHNQNILGMERKQNGETKNKK